MDAANAFVRRSCQNDKLALRNWLVQFLSLCFEPQSRHAKQLVTRLCETDGRFILRPFIKTISRHKATLVNVFFKRGFFCDSFRLSVYQQCLRPCRLPSPGHFLRFNFSLMLDDDESLL